MIHEVSKKKKKLKRLESQLVHSTQKKGPMELCIIMYSVVSPPSMTGQSQIHKSNRRWNPKPKTLKSLG